MSIRSENKKICAGVYDIALIGVMAATLEAVKLGLSFLMNVELVSLLIILYTLFFGKKVVYAVYAFIVLEGLLYGFGVWWLMYIYIWPLLSLTAGLFRRRRSTVFWSVFSGLFGLAFGALSSVPYVFISGAEAAFAYWVAGIPADIVHGAANFVLCLVLFQPLSRILSRVAPLGTCRN